MPLSLKNRILAWVLPFVFFIFAPLAASAAIYVLIPDIEGDATADGYENWIQVLAVSESINAPAAAAQKGSTRQRGNVEFGDIQLVKELDSSSVYLRRDLAAGKSVGKVLIHLTQPGESKAQEPYFVWELDDVLITSVSLSATGDERPTENVSLNFTKIKWTYTKFGKDGKSIGKVITDWDVSKGVAN